MVEIRRRRARPNGPFRCLRNSRSLLGAVWSGIASPRRYSIAERSLVAVTQQTLRPYTAPFTRSFVASLLSVAKTAVQNADVNLVRLKKRYQQGAASRFELLRARFSWRRSAAVRRRKTHTMCLRNAQGSAGAGQGRFDRHRGIWSQGQTLCPERSDAIVDTAYTGGRIPDQQLQNEINEKESVWPRGISAHSRFVVGRAVAGVARRSAFRPGRF